MMESSFKLNAQFLLIFTREAVMTLFEKLDTEEHPFNLVVSKGKNNRFNCILKCETESIQHFMNIINTFP